MVLRSLTTAAHSRCSTARAKGEGSVWSCGRKGHAHVNEHDTSCYHNLKGQLKAQGTTNYVHTKQWAIRRLSRQCAITQ